MKTALIAIFLCAGLGASWLATSQTGGALETKSASGPTSSLARTSSAHYNRLILKFKAETQSKTDQITDGATGAQTRIHAFNAGGGVQVLGQKAVTLSYLKSVSDQTHVVQTDQPLSRAEMKALTLQLAQNTQVEYAEIDEKMFAHFAPNDPDWVANQWAWKSSATNDGATNIDVAWNKNTGGQPVSGAGVVIAVLDSGYITHADLTANLYLTGYDFVSQDATFPFTATANDGNGRDADAADPGDWNTVASDCDVSNSSWHGARVASIVSAIGNNATGMVGVAYGAKVLPVRVLGVCGGYVSDIAAGMRWAANVTFSGSPGANPHPAKILNLSLGSTGTCLNTFQDAVNDVRAAGSIVVASSGNDGSITNISQPANCQGVIAVTAHSQTGNSPNFANDGPGTTISAPGVGIYGTSNSGTTIPTASPGGDTYASASGTSFAAPMVSGVAALLLQIKPTMGVNELTSRLVNSVRAFPSGTYCFNKTICGAGMLDADTATALVLADTAPTTTATANKTDPVARSTVVTLTGSATAGAVGGSTITSVGWTQLSGPSVTLTGANTATATFTTPTTSNANGITFRFQATSSSALSSNSMVSINMVSAPDPVASSGGGGGGGSLDWADLAALLLMALAGLALRRVPALQQQGE